MKKHPDCEDRCQILEHKGYHTCSQTGRCEQLDASPSPQPDAERGGTPETDAAAIGFGRLLVDHGTPDKPKFETTELVPANFARSLERRLRAAPAPREGWIPVAERLPEEGSTYVLCYSKTTLQNTLTGTQLCDQVRYDKGACNWTHWMPLPSAPGAEGEEGK